MNITDDFIHQYPHSNNVIGKERKFDQSKNIFVVQYDKNNMKSKALKTSNLPYY